MSRLNLLLIRLSKNTHQNLQFRKPIPFFIDRPLSAYVPFIDYRPTDKPSLAACEYDEHHLDPLVSLLRASPNIQSLTLNLLDYSSTGLTWSPTALVAALDNPTFPSLHTFRALGESYPDWSSFFDAPESDPLRAFFSRHPGLRTVGLGWVAETAHWRPIDKHDLAALFPSLVHLAAPAYLCGPLMASKLADQLESVAVLDDWYDSTGPDTIAEGIQGMKLSKLQKLAFHVEKEDSIEVEALKVVIGAAPGLEELEFRIPLDEPVGLLCLFLLVCRRY